MEKLKNDLNLWSIESRHSYDFENALEINLWNRERNERAIELEGTVDIDTGKVVELYSTQGYPEVEVKKLLIQAWMKFLGKAEDFTMTMHTTEPGRGYFLYRDRPNSGFSTPWRDDSLELDLKCFMSEFSSWRF